MKNWVRLSLTLFAVLLVNVANAEIIPLRLEVDGVNLGDVPANLNEKGQPVSLNGPVLSRIIGPFVQTEKIQRITVLTGQDDFITIENLTRIGILSNYNEKELKLAVTVPLEMRAVKDYPVVYGQTKAGLGLVEKNFSGYLNLRGTTSYSSQISPVVNYSSKNPAEGFAELVQNLGFATFETTARYVEHDPKAFERVDTSLVHDIEDSQVRLRAGDFNPNTIAFQSGLQAGGLQITKQFNIYPDRSPLNRRSTLVQITNNSLLELFVNDILITRVRVTPGPYNLKDLPLLYGRNTVKVILTDDFGKKEEFIVDMLFDDQILPEGVSDFAYQAGKPSYFLGNEKKYYDDSFSSLYHRYGVNDRITVNLNHQNFLSSNLWGAGVGHLSIIGSNFLDVAHYTDSNVKAASAFRWRYNSPETNWPALFRFRLLASAEARSKDFLAISPIAFSPPNFAERYDLVLQKQITDSSSISVGATKTIGQNSGINDLEYRTVYQNQILKNWRIDFSYSRREQVPDSDQAQITINWLENEGKAQASVTQDIPNNLTALRYMRNSRFNYNDFQMSMYGQRQKDRTTGVESQSMDVYGSYFAPKYEISAQANSSTRGSVGNGTDLTNSERLSLGTALAWTQDSLSISRPIVDSFAVIQAEGLGPKQTLTIPNGAEEDRIILNGNEAFVYANLTSYVERPVKLDSTGLGLGSNLERESYILRPKYRSGLYVPLKVNKALTLRGRLASDKPDQVAYMYGKILDSEGKVFSNNFFTDESGNFVVDGLSYGKYQIELSDPRLKKINFELVDIGEKGRAEQAGEREDSEASAFQLGTIKIENEAGR
jgi:outer membrane usher protein